MGRRIFDTDLVAAADGSMCFKRLSIVKCVVVVVFIDKQQDKSSWTPSYSQPPEWALDYSSLHQSRLG